MGMKIVLDLPDWVDERHLRLFAGVEMVAFKMASEDIWKVKDERCNFCGECCRNIEDERSSHVFPCIDGTCVHLVPESGTTDKFRCGVVFQRPLSCSSYEGGEYKKTERMTSLCCVTHKEQSGE